MVVAAEPAEPAAELARYVPRVVAIVDAAAGEHAWAAVAAAHLANIAEAEPPDVVLAGSGPMDATSPAPCRP